MRTSRLFITNIFLCGSILSIQASGRQKSFNSNVGIPLKTIKLRNDQDTNTPKEQKKSTKKIVHFIRHAEGLHNIAGEKEYSAYERQEFYDCALSEHGEHQCALQRERCQTLLKNAQLVITSPLQRTLQTASLVLPFLEGNVPWLALDSIRETTGLHPCDKRRPRSEKMTQPEFKHIDFSFIENDYDLLYDHYTVREPEAHVASRARNFFDWLENRKETEVVVVTHSAFLRTLFTHVVECDDGDKEKYENCELRSYIIEIPLRYKMES